MDEIVKRGICVEQQSSRLLCYFVHRWLDFRIPEIEALASLFGIKKLVWSLPSGGSHLSPFWYLTLPSLDILKQISSRSLLTKAFIEIWGEGSTFEELRESIDACPENLKCPFYSEELSFKVIVDGWGCKLSQEEKVQCIEKLDYLPLKGKIALKEPDVVYWLIIADPRTITGFLEVPYRLYFGRQISVSGRSIIERFALRDRPYLGPTTMDTEMSFVMCNHAKVKKESMVLDPFVGTGSILVAAGYHGAFTFGCDIDAKILKQRKLNKQNQRCNIFDNFNFYDLAPPTTLLISDIYRSPFRTSLEMFDAVICDPPYGVRAGRRTTETTQEEGGSNNTVGYMCKTLINFSARLLKTGGRLVFFCPNIHGTPLLDEIPKHPMMELVFCCEQYLSMKYSRCLITMEKTSDYNSETVKQFNETQGAPVMSIDDIHSIAFSKAKTKGDPRIPKFRCKQL